MSWLRIVNARLVDPAQACDAWVDVWLRGGKVAGVGVEPPGAGGAVVLDAAGLAMLPALTDLCVHPAGSGPVLPPAAVRAALSGGVTRVAMPGARARLAADGTAHAPVVIHPWPGMGHGLSCLRDMDALQRAMQFAASQDHTLWLAPQDRALEQGGVMADGAYALRLGLAGVPRPVQPLALQAIFDLMGQTGARVHVGPLATREALAAVRAAKAQGLPVSCEVNVHHLHLTDVDIGFFDTRLRFEPPFYGPSDREALGAGVIDGTVDAVVSGHAPLAPADKAQFFERAAPGAPALGLLLALAMAWAERARLPLLQALAPLTLGPDRILDRGAPGQVRGLAPGMPADFCLVDLDAWWQPQDRPDLIHPELSPFSRTLLAGRVMATYIQGLKCWEAP